jgi:outer membrane protein OmpU
MKKLLLATSALVMTAGFASAEVTLSGDARMGIVGEDNGDVHFSNRARVSFALSGESDSGFTFGASFRPSNASDAADGDAGEVFISGAFGTLTMGDTDNAAQATVGQVDGVGFAGVGSHNEISYLGDETSSVRYDFSAGGLSFSASTGQMNIDDNSTSVAAAYAVDGYKVSIGYEDHDTEITGDSDSWVIENHVVLGADATFGNVTLKARYGMGNGYEESWNDPSDLTQLALSATVKADALSVTGFYATSDIGDDEGEYERSNRYGIGAAYDLGGGASLAAGYSSVDVDVCDGGCYSLDNESEWDMGLNFSF